MTPETMAEIVAQAIDVATAPLAARLAAAEAQLAAFDLASSSKFVGELRERVAVQEARTEPLLTKVAELDARPWATKQLWDAMAESFTDIRTKVATLEARAAVPGPMGQQGEPGPMGPQGPAGPSGAKGEAGERGADGAPGMNGKDGAPGERGEKGLDGASGAKGDTGEPGVPGLNGKDGAPGERGEKGADGRDGKDGADGIGQKGLDGRDGKDADMGVLAASIKTMVAKAAATLPRPKDGQSVTVDDVAPMIEREVQRRVDALPKAKDGVGVTGALLDRDGHLVISLSDGTTKACGLVVGRDGAPGLAGKDADTPAILEALTKQINAWERPANGKDGRDGLDGNDGLGFDDLSLVFDDAKGYRLRFKRAEVEREFPIAVPFHTGIWQPGRSYVKGAGVTVKGSTFIALEETHGARPEESKVWRLSAKRGADGKDGKDGRPGGDE